MLCEKNYPFTVTIRGIAMKRVCLMLLVSLAATGAYAIKVDVEELKSGKKIDFQNYVPPAVRPDSFMEIKAIGYGLAAGAARYGANVQVPYYLKYSIIRAVSADEPEKLAADIFSVDPDARVTHIDNLRLIIAAYLEGMYAYSAKDAWTLAVFSTYYNAVYRGKLDYFGGKYKAVVTKRLTAANAGLSTKYYEWPGQTMLLIPLTENAARGNIGTIDADVISDEKVKELVRKDDKNIDERKDLVDIKKKVIEDEKEKLKEEKKKQDESEKKLKEERDRLEKEKKAEETERKKIEEEKKKIPAIKDEQEREKKKKEVEEKEKELKKETEETKKEEKTLKDKEDKTKKEDERIAEKEKKIAEKEKKLEEEKKEITEDEKKKEPEKKTDTTVKKTGEKDKEKELAKKEKDLDKREDSLRDKETDKSIYALKLYYLKIKEYLEEGHYNNEMIMINASTRKVEFTSPVKNICGSRYDIFSEGIAVIAHAGSHKGEHRLVLLDRETLAAKSTGTDDVFWRSFVEVREGSVYVVMIDKGEYYLGRYDGALKRVARSTERVSKETFISFFQDYIYINRHDKKILVLDKNDLKTVDTIDPAVLPVK
ncbi:MAG: hypothetical protein EPN93_16515 [Spirochaetes bacterium]|nr:MAG: hypothetical protein EPN93_16515 [Spirochaetota bacterium]